MRIVCADLFFREARAKSSHIDEITLNHAYINKMAPFELFKLLALTVALSFLLVQSFLTTKSIVRLIIAEQMIKIVRIRRTRYKGKHTLRD